jgi:hypothetical protein
MSEQSRREQKIFSSVLGIFVLSLALFSMYFSGDDTSWFVLLAAIYNGFIIIVIFIELIDEAHADTLKTLSIVKGTATTQDMKEEIKGE